MLASENCEKGRRGKGESKYMGNRIIGTTQILTGEHMKRK